MSTHDDVLVIKRRINAKRELVYAAWTEPKHLSQWFGPGPIRIPECVLEARAGGRLRIVMQMPDDVLYPINGTVLEVVQNERLVMTFDVAEHPAAWHAELAKHRQNAGGDASNSPAIRVEVIFVDSGDATELIINQYFGTSQELKAYVSMGTFEGWSQSFEKLEQLCAAA